jgi:hypothetical protein
MFVNAKVRPLLVFITRVKKFLSAETEGEEICEQGNQFY